MNFIVNILFCGLIVTVSDKKFIEFLIVLTLCVCVCVCVCARVCV